MERVDYYKNNLKGEGILDFPIEEPSLFPEYFTLALSRFLEREKAIKGQAFNEKEANDAFVSSEIKRCNESLIEIQKLFKNSSFSNIKFSDYVEITDEMELEITNYNLYLEYLHTCPKIVIKPTFIPEAIDNIIRELQPYFEISTHTKLRLLIETGDTSEKLLFLDNSNKLSDYFKKAFESKVLKGCNKKELKSWIVNSFQYKKGSVVQDFSPRSVENVLSSKESPCKNPIV